MKLNYKTEKDTEYGKVTEYHEIDNADSIDCIVEKTFTWSFISKGIGKNDIDEMCVNIGGIRVDFPITMVDEVINHVKLTMEEYNNKLHEEQLEDERSTDVE